MIAQGGGALALLDADAGAQPGRLQDPQGREAYALAQAERFLSREERTFARRVYRP